jgi:hypothetical protein
MCVCLHVCVCVYVCMYVCMCVCVCVFVLCERALLCITECVHVVAASIKTTGNNSKQAWDRGLFICPSVARGGGTMLYVCNTGVDVCAHTREEDTAAAIELDMSTECAHTTQLYSVCVNAHTQLCVFTNSMTHTSSLFRLTHTHANNGTHIDCVPLEHIVEETQHTLMWTHIHRDPAHTHNFAVQVTPQTVVLVDTHHTLSVDHPRNVCVRTQTNLVSLGLSPVCVIRLCAVMDPFIVLVVDEHTQPHIQTQTHKQQSTKAVDANSPLPCVFHVCEVYSPSVVPLSPRSKHTHTQSLTTSANKHHDTDMSAYTLTLVEAIKCVHTQDRILQANAQSRIGAIDISVCAHTRASSSNNNRWVVCVLYETSTVIELYTVDANTQHSSTHTQQRNKTTNSNANSRYDIRLLCAVDVMDTLSLMSVRSPFTHTNTLQPLRLHHIRLLSHTQSRKQQLLSCVVGNMDGLLVTYAVNTQNTHIDAAVMDAVQVCSLADGIERFAHTQGHGLFVYGFRHTYRLSIEGVSRHTIVPVHTPTVHEQVHQLTVCTHTTARGDGDGVMWIHTQDTDAGASVQLRFGQLLDHCHRFHPAHTHANTHTSTHTNTHCGGRHCVPGSVYACEPLLLAHTQKELLVVLWQQQYPTHKQEQLRAVSTSSSSSSSKQQLLMCVSLLDSETLDTVWQSNNCCVSAQVSAHVSAHTTNQSRVHIVPGVLIGCGPPAQLIGHEQSSQLGAHSSTFAISYYYADTDTFTDTCVSVVSTYCVTAHNSSSSSRPQLLDIVRNEHIGDEQVNVYSLSHVRIRGRILHQVCMQSKACIALIVTGNNGVQAAAVEATTSNEPSSQTSAAGCQLVVVGWVSAHPSHTQSSTAGADGADGAGKGAVCLSELCRLSIERTLADIIELTSVDIGISTQENSGRAARTLLFVSIAMVGFEVFEVCVDRHGVTSLQVRCSRNHF